MSIDKQSRTEIIELVVGMFDGAPGAQYLSELMALRANGLSLEGLAEALTQSPAFAAAYSPVLANDEFASKFINNLLGDLVAAEDKAWATDWIEAQLNAGSTKAEVIMTAIAALKGAAGSEQFGAAAEALANKVNVAEWYSVEAGQSATSLEELQGVLAGVTNDPATVDAAKGGNTGTTGDSTLTQQADNVSGDAGDNIFLAPVTQNETGSGQLANTFETGDVIKGGAGNDTLKADLIATGSVAGNYVGVAVSAETDSVENVFLRAQTIQLDPAASNTTFAATVDAEKMAGVEQWWSDNSRANITVEDIRNETSEVTFGMRQTDPNVSFTNFFNPLYLEGDTSATSDMTLNIYEGPAGAPSANELANITVREIAFTVAGEQIVLDTDAIRAADTWVELEDALNAALADIGAADTITLTNRGNGQFVFSDTEGREFQVNEGEALVLSVTNNITVTNSLAVGREEVEDPTSTNVVLDAAGNGSQGGTLTIGAMSGGRGVEVFNVDVDRDSHLSVMQSVNGAPYNGLVPNEYLEVVNLNSIGANGDLQIGVRTATLDERAATTGLYNVREVNGADFQGNLNIGLSLNNNVITRYLDEAEGDVAFNYTAGAGNDLFNITATAAVSGDQDFTMNVDMGAGDDRLVINVPFVDETTVDGGEGVNSIVVGASHGTNASNTFAGFANFQTYEIEGGAQHDFTSMPGVEDVIIATSAGASTQLIDLEAQQNVTVSGKNQTIGNLSTANQSFGTITLTDDAGADRVVTLDNTARLSNAANNATLTAQDGILTVNSLVVNQGAAASGTGTSATRNVTVESAGERNVANAVLSFSGRNVETLDLTGTQELTFNVNQIADQTGNLNNAAETALDIDASTLTGDLHLAVNGAMIGNWGTATGLNDTIVGTAGANDTFMTYGAQGNTPVAITGFETIQFGSAVGTLYGDWSTAQNASGIFDAQNVAASHYVIADVTNGNTLRLDNLGTGVTVDMGDANTNTTAGTVNGQLLTEAVTLNSGAAAGTPAAQLDVNYLSNLAGDQTHTLTIGTINPGQNDDTDGYQTINIDIAHAGNFTNAAGLSTSADDRVLNLTLTEDARMLNITGGADNNGFTDTLDLSNVTLPNSLTQIDLSGYEGIVTLVMEQGVLAAAAETDVRFIMSEDSASVTLTDIDTTILTVEHNSVFEFTASNTTAAPSQWVIDNVIAADQAGASINNITRFDVSGLGITSFDQLTIDTASAVGGVGELFIRSEAQDDATALSGTNQNTWEIQVTGLVGLVAGDLTEDNFIFA